MAEGALLTRFPGVRFYGPASVKENVTIGEGTGIGEFCVIDRDVTIGRDCIIIYHVTIPRGTRIGDRVFIGPNTTLLNDKYPPTRVSTPPTIEDDAIVGGGCVIMPGVTVGRRAVVGAGSVVTRDVPPEEVWAGHPLKYLYPRSVYEEKKKQWLLKHP